MLHPATGVPPLFYEQREGKKMACSFFLLSIFIHIAATAFPEGHLNESFKKFEHKFSFKQPMLVNAKGEVPFWERGGDAIPTESQIRICPSIQDRRGWLWTKNSFEKPNWMFDVQFSISGKHTFGADGMAFWYVASKGSGGPVFGNSDQFVGLGIIIDTFDNDGMGDSPKISVYISDGSLRINSGLDGSNQDVGNCIRFIRNKRYDPKIKVVYFQKKLEVWVHEGDSESDDDYQLCAEVGATSLPTNGYFGVSAATGGLSDDHDVKSFLVHSLLTNEEYRKKMIEKYDTQAVKEAEDKYRERAESFDTKRSQYKKDHDKQDKWQKQVEMEENVQLIYDMQHSLIRSIKDITRQIESVKSGIGGGPGGAGGGGASDGTVLAAEGRMTHLIREIKSQLETGSVKGGGPASEQMQPFYEMKETLHQLMKKVEELQSALGTNTRNGDDCNSSCLSTWFFIMAMLVQFGIVVTFLYYKHSQERNAKKFF